MISEELEIGFTSFLKDVLPKDVTDLENNLKIAEEEVITALTGSVPAYLEAVKIRDAAKSTLRNAISLTTDESTAISLSVHNFLITLHDLVKVFDEKNGISYSVTPTKKSRNRISGAGLITREDFDKIPSSDRLAYSMVYQDGGIALIGKSGNSHTCRTMATLVRHQEN